MITLPTPKNPVETGDETVNATEKKTWEKKINAHVK